MNNLQQTPETLNPKRQQQAKDYARLRRRLFALELVLGGAYVLVWVFSGLSPWLRDVIHRVTSVPWAGAPLFALGMGLPYALLEAPLSYFGGFVLPHRYGQLTQTLTGWLADQPQGAPISGVLGRPVIAALYSRLNAAPPQSRSRARSGVVAFTVLLSNLAPVLIFPLFFKYQPLTDDELVDRFTRLAERAGATVQGVYTFDMSSKTVAANAALMGLGATRRVVLGDTLLNKFTADEIETILAHELGHHVHKDIVWGIVVQSSLTLAGLWLADAVMRWGVNTLGLAGLADPATLPLFILAMAVFGLVTMPLGNAWSRRREAMADRYALQATGKPRAFISAMTRLANQNLADAEPPAWVEFALHSHPSIHKRVAIAKPVTSEN